MVELLKSSDLDTQVVALLHDVIELNPQISIEYLREYFNLSHD